MTTYLVASGSRCRTIAALAAFAALVSATMLIAPSGTAQARDRVATPLLAPRAGIGANPAQLVRNLQRTLVRRGYDLGAPGVDGRFGPLTAAAVRRFQRRNRLTVDGVVGSATRAALRSSTRLIRRGDGYAMPGGSDSVRRLQRRLRRASEHPGPVDGRFGPVTESAVRRFQRRARLSVDGLVGAATVGALRRAVMAAGIDAHADRSERGAMPEHGARDRKLASGGSAIVGSQRAPAPTDRRPEHLDDAGLAQSTRGVLLAITAALALLSCGALASGAARMARRRHGRRRGGGLLEAARGEGRRHAVTAPASQRSSTVDTGDERAQGERRAPDAPDTPGLSRRTSQRSAGRADGRAEPRAPEIPRPSRAARRTPLGAERVARAAGRSPTTPVLGYACIAAPSTSDKGDTAAAVADILMHESRRRGLALLQVVRDRSRSGGRALSGPGSSMCSRGSPRETPAAWWYPTSAS